VDWTPIAALPPSLKDGRQVLLWHADYGADVGTWNADDSAWDDHPDGYWEALYECALISPVSHFAEIAGPERGPYYPNPTDELRAALIYARQQASQAGAMHALWDLIADGEACLANRATLLNWGSHLDAPRNLARALMGNQRG
jgi:hypothetical protein